MLELAGKTIALVGRLRDVPRRVVIAALERREARVRREIGRRTDLLVLGAGAASGLRDGTLVERIEDADRLRVPCASERTLLRALGLLPHIAVEPGAMRFDELAVRARLDPQVVRLLVLFDLIEAEGDNCGFRDLVAAREVGRLLDDGVALADIIEGTARLHRRTSEAPGHLLARHKLASDAEGRLVMRLGNAVAELGGQFRLDLPDAGNSNVDALFELAEKAEQAGDLVQAEQLYRRCIDLDRRDPITPFNLAIAPARACR